MRINATREGVDPPPVVDTGDLGFPISRESGDCGQTTSTRCSLTLGIPAIGSARDSDTDYRSVSLVAGKSYVITLKLGHITDGFASAEEFTESVLEFRDSTDSLEEETMGFGPRAATFTYAVPAGEGGTFYVKVKTSEPARKRGVGGGWGSLSRGRGPAGIGEGVGGSAQTENADTPSPSGGGVWPLRSRCGVVAAKPAAWRRGWPELQ